MARMGLFVLALRLVLAGVFGTAGIAKLLDLEGSRRALGDFGVPRRMIRAGALMLPLAELTVAIALVPKGSARWGALAAIVLLLGFIGGIARALARGQAPDCHCFGQIHSAPAGRGTLTRNAGLAVVAAVVLWQAPGASIAGSDAAGAEAVTIVVTVVAILVAALALQLWMSNRGTRQELADARAQLALFPPGLPVGTLAPNFALKDLEGNTVTLDSLCARGKLVLLAFVGPRCGPCWLLLPHLHRWQETLSDRLTIALLAVGSESDNMELLEEHGITGGLFLHAGPDLMKPYRVEGTPTTVLVTSDRRIASATMAGVRPVEPAVRLALQQIENGSDPDPTATRERIAS
jgi:peroxiredoxin